jgi:fluoride exporter
MRSMVWLAIGVGGGIGALARHGLNQLLQGRFPSDFPLGILVVNLTGCLAIGVLAGLIAAARVELPEAGRHLLVTGLLGGFTTFSAFGLDTFTLARGGDLRLALANVTASVLFGLAAVWVGFAVGSWRP